MVVAWDLCTLARVRRRHRDSGFAVRLAAATAVCLAAACSESEMSSAEPTVLPATDTNPAADIVEVRLAAGPAKAELLAGSRADVWAYSDLAAGTVAGSVPGPLIEAKRGDRVIVHFRNDLPEPTTIHWHGVRVPATSDGTPSSQVPVAPGAEFTYEFVAEDAGTFWYHPHVRGDVQVERGLHGMLVVRDASAIDVDEDRAFVLDDVKLDANGQLSTTTEALDIMLGRQGNVLLVNGRQRPAIRAKAGGRERWRFVNASNGRYFNLRLPGRSFLVVAWDGGLLADPYAVDTLLVVPGERYEVLVDFSGADNSTLALETIHYDRGHMVPDPGPKVLMKVALGGDSITGQMPLPVSWGVPVDLSPPPGAVEHALKLSEDEGGGGEPRFFINDVAFPDLPPIDGTSGDVEVWSVRNDSEMDHPFHLHGMFFRVLDVDGVAPDRVGWKDTVNVPQKKTLRFVVRYGTPGVWMFHCHILEHAERGMMGELVLAPRP
jgi:FtsP/CotA-like multicopper oxidase with cupredoxin domain